MSEQHEMHKHEMHRLAEYSTWHYKRGVEHGRREMRTEMLKALESMSKEARAELERETNEKEQ